MHWDGEQVGMAVGWIVGVAAAVVTAASYWGGMNLPAGTYPIILLALLFLGPPVLVGGIAGAVTGFIAGSSFDRIKTAREQARDEKRKAGVDELAARMIALRSGDIGKILEQEIAPAMAKEGRELDGMIMEDRRSPFHLAAAAGNEPLIEALAERGPDYLFRTNSGKLYLDFASPEAEPRLMAAFARGFTRFVEKRLREKDDALAETERPLVAEWLEEKIGKARQPDQRSINLDLSAFMDGPLYLARAEEGLKRLRGGQFAEAVAPLTSAIRLRPSLPSPRFNRGLVYRKLGNHEYAIGDFTEVIKLNPDYVKEAYYFRADVQGDAGARDKAMEDYDEAIRLDPKYTSAYIDRGYMLLAMGQTDRAITDFKQALALEPDNGLARKNLDVAYRSKRADDATLAELTAAAERDPGDAAALCQRGEIYAIRGEYDQALTDFSEALRLSPDDSAIHFKRAGVYFHKGDFTRALADYSEAARLRPEDSGAYCNCGNCCETLGRKAEAAAHYRRALEIDPSMQYAVDGLQRLGELA